MSTGQFATQPVAHDVRYGLYLRPSLAMSRAQASIHDLLARQYGLQSAGRFPPHATLKGFFRGTVTTAQLRARLDPVVAGRPAFTVFNRGVVAFGHDGIVLDIHRSPAGAPNTALQELHEAALEALLPMVHADCEFTWTDPGAGERFHAHLTLAFADIPAACFPEVLRFVREAEPSAQRASWPTPCSCWPSPATAGMVGGGRACGGDSWTAGT